MNPFENNLGHYFSSDQLKNIKATKIGIGGAGGLGSNLAILLARCGFVHFEIIDKDNIEASNLNRQHYFIDEIGQSKVQTLQKHLNNINPSIHLILHAVEWSTDNAQQFFSDCDFVIEAFDQACNKKTFVEFYQDKAKYIISGNGMAGLKVDIPLEVKKVDNVYLVGDHCSDINEGHPPLAPRVIQCAAMMAGVVLDLVIA